MKRLAPEVLQAGRVEWQLFVTLTWRGQPPRAEKRERGLRLYLRRLAVRARVPFGSLVWFAREEAGELGSRPHYHVLIAGFPSSCLGFDFGVCVGQLWEGGWCEARLWVRGLGAVDYSLEDGANCYEGSKYRADLPIISSPNLVVRGHGPRRGDGRQEEEDAGQRDNPELGLARRGLGVGLDRREPDVTSLVAERRGYLLAVNASRTHVEYHHQADVTGAC